MQKFEDVAYTPYEKKLFEKMRVCILLPVMYDYPKFWRSLVNMICFSWHQGLKVEEMAMTERTVVDWARNDLAREAVKRVNMYDGKLFTHLLWLDTDTIFKPDLLCQLARHDVDAVSVTYYARLYPHKPLIYIRNKKDPEGLSHFPLIDIPPMLVRVDAFGFGGCLMKRDVFERVSEPWFTLDYRAGEDIAFCSNARKYGIEFYCDGQYTVAHIGEQKIVTKTDYEKWYADNLEAITANREKVELGGKENGRCND